MAYTQVSLPAPAANGSGAAVDVSSFGATKTITVKAGGNSVLRPSVIVEVSNQASPTKWAPVAFFAPDGEETIEVAARWMRATVTNFKDGSAPVVEVGGEDDGTEFATLVAPSGSGDGAGVDTSSLPSFKTVHVGGPFRGSVSILISQDGGTTYQEAMTFLSGQSGIQSKVFAADFMKVRRDGVPTIDPGTPIVNIGACSTGGGGGGARGGGDTVSLVNNELGTVIIGTPVYNDAAGGFKKAQADAQATGRTIGLTRADVAAGESGSIQLSGAITLTTAEWDAICGTSGGLSFNTPYYLSAATAGKLTATPPSAAGEVVQQVIIALSTTLAVIRIADPEVLGSGNNIIQLTNNSGAPLIIGTPVYSDAADSMAPGVADGSGKSNIVGLVADTSVGDGAQGDVAVGGIIVATTDQWDAVAGTSGGLTFNTPYYLDPTTAGKLTSIAPVNAGQEVVQVIIALSTTEARIAIQPPILL